MPPPLLFPSAAYRPGDSGPSSRRGGVWAFTLVELLVVMTIIVLILSLVIPVMRTSNTIGQCVGDITGVLEQARAYATANNTYVFVGIEEVDSSASATATPQTVANATAGGRVAVAVFASRDGTRGYDIISPDTSWSANYAKGANLILLNKIMRFDNLHLASSLGTPPASGTMARPTVSPVYLLGSSTCKSVTPIAYPLGSDLDPSKSQYYFLKVINFDPQGVARIQYAGNTDGIVAYMEVSLQQTHGSNVPPVPSNPQVGDHAAMQLDCMTGSVRVFRP